MKIKPFIIFNDKYEVYKIGNDYFIARRFYK